MTVYGTNLAAEDTFDLLSGENREVHRNVEITRSRLIDALQEGWEQVARADAERDAIRGSPIRIRDIAKRTAEKIAAAHVIRAGDLQQFIAEWYPKPRLVSMRSEEGKYLSYLINNCQDEQIVFALDRLGFEIDRLGHENRKHLIVYGNVGNFLGSHMEAGSITHYGNAKEAMGSKMNGGVITSHGDAGENVGNDMHKGEIYLEGTYRSLGTLLGKVYHKGRLLQETSIIL